MVDYIDYSTDRMDNSFATHMILAHQAKLRSPTTHRTHLCMTAPLFETYMRHSEKYDQWTFLMTQAAKKSNNASAALLHTLKQQPSWFPFEINAELAKNKSTWCDFVKYLGKSEFLDRAEEPVWFLPGEEGQHAADFWAATKATFENMALRAVKMVARFVGNKQSMASPIGSKFEKVLRASFLEKLNFKDQPERIDEDDAASEYKEGDDDADGSSPGPGSSSGSDADGSSQSDEDGSSSDESMSGGEEVKKKTDTKSSTKEKKQPAGGKGARPADKKVNKQLPVPAAKKRFVMGVVTLFRIMCVKHINLPLNKPGVCWVMVTRVGCRPTCVL
jgi:hypothetical protein